MFQVKATRTFIGTNAERTAAAIAAFKAGDEFIETDTGIVYQHTGAAWLSKSSAGGSQGDTGVAGAKGDTGVQGDTGAGIQGDTGVTGDTGPGGGDKGDTGVKGDTGAQGDTGAGVQGDTGVAGSQGIQGDTGVTGAKGDTGNAGPQGDTGVTGSTGGVGATGPAGPQGDTGVKGDTGSGGAPGGSDTHVQYNNAGAFGGSSNFTWSNTPATLTLTDNKLTPNIVVTSSGASGQASISFQDGAGTTYSAGVDGSTFRIASGTSVAGTNYTVSHSGTQIGFAQGSVIYGIAGGTLDVAQDTILRQPDGGGGFALHSSGQSSRFGIGNVPSERLSVIENNNLRLDIGYRTDLGATGEITRQSFYDRNTTPATVEYAREAVNVVTRTAASEASSITWSIRVGGALSSRLLLHPTANQLTGNTTYVLSTQSYTMQNRGAGVAFQGEGAGQNAAIEIFTKDGDGTDITEFSIYGVGTTAGVTNRERLLLRYDNTVPDTLIWSEAAGTGTVRPLRFRVGNNDVARMTTSGGIRVGPAAFTSPVVGAVALDTYLNMDFTAAPTAPTSTEGVHIYLSSGGRIVFAINDGASTRYKSLLLTGTGVTWAQATTPPA